MTNQLPAVMEDMTYEELLEATGQAQVSNQSAFPQLRINTHSDDEDNNILPVGTYSLYLADDKVTIYSKTAEFRPFMQTYQYRVYDEATKAFSNRTILFKSWNDEKFDEKGGLACGKIPGKKQKDLSEADLLIQKKIRCRRIMFGLVSFTGQTAHKDKEEPKTVKVTDVPVMWATAGQSFMPIGEAIEKLTEKKLLMFNHTLLLTTKREKNGATVFYLAQAEPSIHVPALPLTQANMATLRQFQDYINTENAVVIDKWKKVQAKRAAPTRKEVDLVAELSPPNDDDLNDPLPDNMTVISAG